MADPIGSFSGLASGIQWRDMVEQIMSIEKARRVNPLVAQQSAQNTRKDAWTSYQSLVAKLTTASKALQDGSAFEKLKVSTGTTAAGKSLLTATAGAAAVPGSYSVEVVALAKAEKLSTVAQSATDQPLGLGAGEIVVNGRAVKLDGNETLAQLRDRINATNSGVNPSGVSASILSSGPGEFRLILTASGVGARGIEMTDSEGGALKQLGLLSAGNAANTGATGQVQSARFGSDTQAIKNVLGLEGPPSKQRIFVGGKEVFVDLEKDSLQDVLSAIKEAGGQARMVSETYNGRSMQRLEVEGGVAASDDPDSQRILDLLGFTRSDRPSVGADGTGSGVVSAGSDAVVRIDGFTITRRSNTVSDAIAGVTVNLQSAEPGQAVNVSVTRDTDAMIGAVKEFASAYNAIRAFATAQSAQGQPLASNGTLRSTVSQLTNVLLTDLKGLPGGALFGRGALVGVALSKTGTLDVDESALRAALDANLPDVRTLFGTGARSSSSELQFVTSSGKTQSGSYQVEITQLAAKAAYTGSDFAAAYDAGGATGEEALTIRDAFTGRTLTYTVPSGKTLSEVVDELNRGFTAQGMRLSAREEGGALRLDGAEYGSAASFTLADVDESGALARLGLAAGTYAGKDVKGYLYNGAEKGEELTGSGQTLRGGAGSAADGLVLRYTGSALGQAGTVDFTLGLAGTMARQSELISRAGDGTIAQQIESVQHSAESLTTRIDAAEQRLEQRRQAMIEQFARMEEAMSRLQSQGNWLAGQLQAMRPRGD
jgi:flagellar hook-associated protein 2